MGKTKGKKRILYLMHVQWGWIKQRPHFIAEGLDARYDVWVLYRTRIRGKMLVKNDSHVSRLPLLPIVSSNKTLIKIQTLMQKLWIYLIASFFKPDVVWVTFPSLCDFLPEKCKKAEVIYDCMDDAENLFADPKYKKETREFEEKLVDLSDTIFVSSNHLLNVMKERYGSNRNYHLLRNALKNEFVESYGLEEKEKEKKQPGSTLQIGYIGTIAEWIDFQSIKYCVDRIPNLVFHFIGPVEYTNIEKHERIIFHGAVEHRNLRNTIQDYDALIMPFENSPVIDSVDPVKLYEYLSFNKEVISIYYDEILRFGPFVHFYRDSNGLYEIIRNLMEGTLVSKIGDKGNVKDFLKENTWDKRVEEVNRLLQS